MAHFRRVLSGDTPLDRDTRDGIKDMLLYMEEHLLTMWQIVEDEEAHELLTRQADDKIRP